jgi:Protein of unknown function (DUF3800)
MFAHTAYFDDSGKKEQGTLLVGGYIASIRQWNDFEAAWRFLLAHKQIREFKRGAFNAREIGDWPNLERDRFLADLAQIIHDHTKHAFAVAISMPAWRKANAKYQMTESNFYPYPICARTCIKLARDWCDAEGYDKKEVQYVFYKGSEHSGHLIGLLKRDGDPVLRKLVPVPANSEEVRPIQAADYFAWEVRRQAMNNPDLIRHRHIEHCTDCSGSPTQRQKSVSTILFDWTNCVPPQGFHCELTCGLRTPRRKYCG